MLSTSLVLLLRIIHIVIGVVWVGSVVFIALFLLPTVKALGPGGGAVMQHLTQVRRMPMVLMTTVVLTILSGVTLLWNASMGFTAAWMSSGPGRTYSLGAALAIVVAIIGMAVNSPTAGKIGALGAAIRAGGGPPTAEQGAEMQRLQKRLTLAMRASAVLLIGATMAMAVGRYVP